MNKFITKAAIVISTVVSANYLTPKVYRYSRSFGEKIKNSSCKYAVPIAIGVLTGGIISSACQLMFNKEIKKEHLISDLKDAFISSSILGGFGILVTKSSKAFGLIWQTNNSFIKRCGINGLVGGIYATMRGLIKPEKEDKLTLKNIGHGIAEGVFLGEGARMMSKIPTKKLLNKSPEIIKDCASYLKIFAGAALGSLAFRISNYLLVNKKDVNEIKDTHSLFEHLYKGNSYPTMII